MSLLFSEGTRPAPFIVVRTQRDLPPVAPPLPAVVEWVRACVLTVVSLAQSRFFQCITNDCPYVAVESETRMGPHGGAPSETLNTLFRVAVQIALCEKSAKPLRNAHRII
jgi:hypothetical protein